MARSHLDLYRRLTLDAGVTMADNPPGAAHPDAIKHTCEATGAVCANNGRVIGKKMPRRCEGREAVKKDRKERLAKDACDGGSEPGNVPLWKASS